MRISSICGWARSVVVGVLAAAVTLPCVQAGNWDGEAPLNGGVTYFDWSGRLNFYGNSDPTWNSSTALYFSYNNSGHSTLNQNIGYKAVQSLIYESSFSGSTTLQGSDGFNVYWKIENLSAGHHTVNVPLVVEGTALELNPVSGDLTIGGTINNYLNRDLLVYGNNGHTLTLNSTFSGTGADLIVHQNSTVVINGSQTYTGDTILNAGTIQLGASDRIADVSDLDINSGATFNLNNFNETVATMDNDGTLTLGTGQLIVNGGSAEWSGTMSASSGGSVVKKGSGTISITGNNSGMAAGSSLFIVGGTVGLNNNNAAGSATVYLGETSGSAAAAIDISTAGITIGNAITVRSGSSGVKTFDNASAGTITFSGAITLNDDVNVTASSGETTIFSGGIAGGAGNNVIKQGAGTVRVSASSSYSGYTYVDEGTLSVGSGGDITGSAGIDLGSAVYNNGGGAGSANAVLDLQSGASDLDRAIAVKSGSGSRTITSAGNNSISGDIEQQNNLTITSSSGTLTLGNVNMANSGNNDLNVGGAGGTTIGGTLSASSGASEVNKSGSGTLVISGNNAGSSYMLNIAAGTVSLNSVNALGTAYSDKINFTGSSTLDVNANIAPASLGLRVGNGFTATVDVNAGNTFTVATLANISGSGTFTKTGGGTMEVTGNSSGLSGTVNVNQGTLDVQGSLGGSVSVASGATLTGAGTVGTLTVGSGSVLSPGNSPGTLSAGNTVWAGGGTYLWEINDVDAGAGTDSGWDLLDVTGTLTISASAGNEFIIDVTSLTLANAGGQVHDFNSLTSYQWLAAAASGGVIGFDASDFTVDYSGFQNANSGLWSVSADANNVYVNYTAGAPQVSAVPEPSSLMLLGLAGVMVLRVRGALKFRKF